MILYLTEDGRTQLDVKLENETVWLTQEQMVTLFEKDQSTIARHIANAFREGEVDKESNMHFLHITSKYRPTAIYNLDVIISVGYRVHSQRGVHFRRWASTVLKEYLIHGYAVKNDLVQQKYEELKQLVSVMGRMDSNLKSAFDLLCAQFGMSANTAMNVFARAVVQRGKIPFDIRGDKAVDAAENEGLTAFRALRMMAEAGMLPELSDGKSMQFTTQMCSCRRSYRAMDIRPRCSLSTRCLPASDRADH